MQHLLGSREYGTRICSNGVYWAVVGAYLAQLGARIDRPHLQIPLAAAAQQDVSSRQELHVAYPILVRLVQRLQRKSNNRIGRLPQTLVEVFHRFLMLT